MKLANVGRYFSRDQVTDAYTGAELFRAQTTPHDDHTSSGATARRRTMITDESVSPPARRAVSIYGESWVVGSSNPDGFLGAAIRRSHDLKKSTGVLTIRTPAQACLQAGGTPAHAHREYFKDMVDSPTESDYTTLWNVFFALGEPVQVGAFFSAVGGRLYRARSVYLSVDEYLVAEADEFEADAVQVAVFTSIGTLDIATDTYTATNITASVIQTGVPKFYRFSTEAESARKPGDRTVFVAKSDLTPAPGTAFTMGGRNWTTLAVVDELDAWALQARLA